MTGPDATTGSPRLLRHARRATWPPAVAALGVWLVALAAGLAVRSTDATSALTVHVQVLPLAVGVPVALLGVWVAMRRPLSPLAAGALLGLLGGLVTFSLLVILAGTPYGIGSVYGDCGRTVAAAERFRLSPWSADQFIKGNPAQYPPLWFWLWGRAAAVTGREAYQVQGLYQASALGLLVIATGAAWRQLVSWPRALVAATFTYGLLVTSYNYDPCKGHEISGALLSLPALLLAHLVVIDVLEGRRRRRSAAVAGLLIGLAFLMYPLFVLFSVPALLVLWTVRAARSRRLPEVLGHVGITAAAGFVTVSWYLVPFLLRSLGNTHARAPDPLMVVGTLNSRPGLPADLGWVIGATCLAAVVLLAARPRHPVSQGLLAIIAGSVVVQVAGLTSVASGAESLYSYRTEAWLVVVCAGAVVLLAPLAWRRLAPRLPAELDAAAGRRTGAALLAVLLLLGAHQTWLRWHAPAVGLDAPARSYLSSKETFPPARAYLAPLPTCRRVKGLPTTVQTEGCFPAVALRACLHEAYGAAARDAVLVSYDERAAIFFGSYLYLGNNGGATGPLDAWQERFAVVRRLASLTDPAALVRAVDSTPFGPVDGFVLAVEPNGSWRWVAQTFHRTVPVDFSPAVFATPDWHLCRADDVAIALRTRPPR